MFVCFFTKAEKKIMSRVKGMKRLLIVWGQHPHRDNKESDFCIRPHPP